MAKFTALTLSFSGGVATVDNSGLRAEAGVLELTFTLSNTTAVAVELQRSMDGTNYETDAEQGPGWTTPVLSAGSYRFLLDTDAYAWDLGTEAGQVVLGLKLTPYFKVNVSGSYLAAVSGKFWSRGPTA